MAKLIQNGNNYLYDGVSLNDGLSLTNGMQFNFGNMQFNNTLNQDVPNVHLTVFRVMGKGVYAFATTGEAFMIECPEAPVRFTNGDSGTSGPEMSTSLPDTGFPVASGTCDLDKDGNPTNIKLTLTQIYSGSLGTNGLHFSNANVNEIKGSDQNDIIYINSQGVNSGATLDFSRGNDTIKFNDATTVNTIRGGKQQYTYSSA